MLGSVDDLVLLPILLKDIIQRKCSFHKLTKDLGCYCRDKDSTDFKGHVFVNAVIKILPTVPQSQVTEEHLQILAGLVYHFNSSLEDLLSVICDICDQTSGSTSLSTVLIQLLESTLQHAQRQEALGLDGDHPDLFVDKPFSFGESALVFAARRRNFQVMRVLLRYGADEMMKWLNFQNVLEVLLFAPHTVYVTAEDMRATEQCIALLTSIMECSGEVITGLEDKHKAGYFPLCPHWRHLIPHHITEAQGPSLRHRCRRVIRDTLRKHGVLPAGITSLPLPNLIQDYIDIGH